MKFCRSTFFCIVTLTTTVSCLAEWAASPETRKLEDVRISAELCQHLQRGHSKLLFNIFCEKSNSGKPQPPLESTFVRKSRRSSEICDRLCEEGNGGAICDCSEGLPPAVMPPPPPTQPKVAAEISRQNSNFAPKLPIAPP